MSRQDVHNEMKEMFGEVISFGLVNPYTNQFALAFVFIVMAAVLTVRPWGLFGKPEQ